MPKYRKRSIDSCPNRLFLEYLREWRDKAEECGSRASHTYNKAMKTLNKYPLPLKCGKEAIILENFGDKICKMLDDRLEKDAQSKGVSADEYLEDSRKVHPSWWDIVESQCTPAKIPTKKRRTSSSKGRQYIPQKNSGPYAILITLYNDSKSCEGKGFMTKAEIIREAQCICTKSFSVPDSNCRYTAWSAMGTLVSKELIKKYGNPAKYELTDEGKELAEKLDYTSSRGAINGIEKYMKQREGNTEILDLTLDNDKLENLDNKYPKQNNIKTVDLTLCSDEDDDNIDFKLTADAESSPSMANQYLVSQSVQEKCVSSSFSCLKPKEFQVVLCVDIRETMGSEKTKRSEMKRVLNKYDISYTERSLNLGDFLWIAQEVNSGSKHPIELVLDYIVERKCMSDLAQSIRDGRYHEQKLRLKKSGLNNIIYLIEDLKQIQHQSLPEKTLRQAMQNTQIIDYIHVKLTENIDATAQYLEIMTKYLQNKYKNETLYAVGNGTENRSANQLICFSDFNEVGSKYKNTTIKELLTRQLMQIHGMSYNKAASITEKYPTLNHLISAYASCQSDKDKDSLLANFKVGLLQRNLGLSLSRTVAKMFAY